MHWLFLKISDPAHTSTTCTTQPMTTIKGHKYCNEFPAQQTKLPGGCHSLVWQNIDDANSKKMETIRFIQNFRLSSIYLLRVFKCFHLQVVIHFVQVIDQHLCTCRYQHFKVAFAFTPTAAASIDDFTDNVEFINLVISP